MTHSNFILLKAINASYLCSGEGFYSLHTSLIIWAAIVLTWRYVLMLNVFESFFLVIFSKILLDLGNPTAIAMMSSVRIALVTRLTEESAKFDFPSPIMMIFPAPPVEVRMLDRHTATPETTNVLGALASRDLVRLFRNFLAEPVNRLILCGARPYWKPEYWLSSSRETKDVISLAIFFCSSYSAAEIDPLPSRAKQTRILQLPLLIIRFWIFNRRMSPTALATGLVLIRRRVRRFNSSLVTEISQHTSEKRRKERHRRSESGVLEDLTIMNCSQNRRRRRRKVLQRMLTTTSRMLMKKCWWRGLNLHLYPSLLFGICPSTLRKGRKNGDRNTIGPCCYK